MKWFYKNIFDLFYFANIWNILFKVQLWNMCEVIGYWYFWYSDFLLQYFSFCRYLTNSQQRTIVHAHQYVWSYQILIFLIFWYFCTLFFHFAIILNILFKLQLWMHANMCEVIGYWYFGKHVLGISTLELASLFISEWLPWELFKLRWKLVMIRNFCSA